MTKREIKILEAAKANDFATVSKILMKSDKSKSKGRIKACLDINAKDFDGDTIFHYAAKYGNIEIMEELVSRGVLFDCIDKIGWRPLSYASANNNREVVEKLIDWGSKVNILNEANSPIHIASALGHMEIVKILVEKGADIHNQNQRRQTPIDVACENNHYGIVNVLLSGSSKQIEEFSENSFRTMAKRSLSPPIMQTYTLPATSNGNVTNMFLNTSSRWSDKTSNTRNLKCRTIGSQEQISSSDCYNIYTFNSHPTKKSESLNAIFIQDYEDDHIGNEAKDDSLKSTASNEIKNPKKQDLEIILPYPSKFSTSEVLKIKSPLLPMKNHQRKEQTDEYKETCSPTLEFKLLCDQRPKNSHYSVSKGNAEEFIKYRNDKNHFRTQRTSNKSARSSLPLQSHYNISEPLKSPSLESSPQSDKVNGKPPTTKHKVHQTPPIEVGNIRTLKSSMERSALLQASTSENGRSGDFIIGNVKDNCGFSCEKWIKSIGLFMIWDSLIRNGFDSFLALSLASDEELLSICNNRIDHLDTLKNELNNLSIPSLNELVFSLDIQATLTQLGFEKYYANFIKEGYFYMKNLPKASDRLMNQLGITKLGHRKLLIKCINLQLQNHHITEERIRCNGSASDLQRNLVNLSPTKDFKRNELWSKCNSLTRFNFNNIEPNKKSPPPIPPRSCSILNDSPNKQFTLNDILTESMCQENISKRKRNYCASSDLGGDMQNLDDIVNMLENLGKELDNELKQTH